MTSIFISDLINSDRVQLAIPGPKDQSLKSLSNLRDTFVNHLETIQTRPHRRTFGLAGQRHYSFLS